MKLNRREFLVASSAALLPTQRFFAAAGTPTSDSAAAVTPAAATLWHQKIKRIGQLNFNERDPAELDVNAWADYWAEVKVDAVLLSVTGIIAFYPTDVPYHRRSAFLNGRDLFGECLAAAKKRNLRVIARYSPDLQWREAAEAHPEWFRRSQDGALVESPEAAGLCYTCAFSAYFSQQMPAIMREVNARYDVDGIFTNAWPQLGELPQCFCESCRNAPAPGTPAFYERHDESILDTWKLYEAIAREKKPDNVFFGNLGGGTRALVNLDRLGQRAQWFNADNQGRGGDDTPAWGCAQQGRVARCVMKGRTITNVTGGWATGQAKWRNAAKSPAEAELWMAQTAASGMTIWYHWLGGQTGLGEDRRWMETGRQFLQWMARHDAHFTYRQSLTNLAVLWTQQSNRYYRPPDSARRGSYSDYLQGLYYALLEGRFLFDFVHEDDLGPKTLKKYSALLLPNVALLSDQQARQLRAYVDGGGSLLTTFETGMYDEMGKRRSNSALADLFGIELAGEVQGPLGNSFFARIERAHEILSGFTNTHVLPGAEYRLPIKATGQPVLTVIPPYTSYPPERVFSPTPHTTEPAVVLVEKGNSRLIHFPGDIDRSAWRSGNSDLSQLLQNSIRWLIRGAAPVSVAGDGLVELFAWETDPGIAIHVLNYNNPNLHKGWIRKHYPLGPQAVTLQLPPGMRVASVQLLRAQTPVEFRQTGSTIAFTIPKVVDYEIAALTRG